MSSVIFHVLSTLCEHVPSGRSGRGLVGIFTREEVDSSCPTFSAHARSYARTDRYVNSVVEPSVILP